MNCPTNVLAIVAVIWYIEGGDATRYPYGIKSVQTDNPRRVCIRTVENNIVRWNNAGRKVCFIDFLADRYCPESSDPIGNRNWKKNAKARLNHTVCR